MAMVRAIGRVGLTALVVNCIIGTSIFGMPGEVYRQLGRASPLAMMAGALCMAVFIACAAEVGSQFSEAGGAYLYVRRTFGRFAGLLVAWFWFLAGASGLAAASNLFVSYLGAFAPALTVGWVRALTLGLLIAIPTIVNCRGVRGGSALSAFMALVKIAPLVLLALLGVAHFGAWQALPRATDMMLPGWSAWGTVLLLLLAAFGGWEDALAPAGEVKQPRRTLPFALAAGLLISAALYIVVQYVVTAAGVSTDHALADVAVILVGPAGSTLVAVAAMLSTYGYISADVVTTPRLLYSLAVEGDLPDLLARVHPRFHTPMYPIVGFVAVGYLLALSGTFLWALALSAGADAVVYMGICASLIRLRRLNPNVDALRIPCGRAVAVAGIAVSVVLLAQLDAGRLGLMLITAAIAGANWLWAVSAERQRRVIASRGAT
jgi:basic amino acid/polyamine antiporter, APA family